MTYRAVIGGLCAINPSAEKLFFDVNGHACCQFQQPFGGDVDELVSTMSAMSFDTCHQTFESLTKSSNTVANLWHAPASFDALVARLDNSHRTHLEDVLVHKQLGTRSGTGKFRVSTDGYANCTNYCSSSCCGLSFDTLLILPQLSRKKYSPYWPCSPIARIAGLETICQTCWTARNTPRRRWPCSERTTGS
jgi:hypothetical protein